MKVVQYYAAARRKSRIKDIRILPEVGEVGVVEYEIKGLNTFSGVFQELESRHRIRRIGKVGALIFPLLIHEQIKRVFPGAEVVEAEKLLYDLRSDGSCY